jgi:protein NrfD
MIEFESTRNNHLIDPALHVWGWEIPLYLFLGGMAAGIMVISALIGRRIPPEKQSPILRLLPLAAPVILSIGMLALFLDLENKLHVYRFYLAFRWTSPMSWGSWILLAIYPATIFFALARIGWIGPKWLPLLERANLILGVALGAYTGVLLSTLGARALWSSLLLAPLFLVSGVSAGIALAMLLRVTHEEHEILRRWDVLAIAIEIVLLAAFFIDLATSGGAAGRAAASMFFGGPYTAVFWSLVIVAGLIVPLLLEVFEKQRQLRATIVAPGLLLIGGLALRWIFVAAGQAM